ncbi:hypothetical protein HDU96_010707 [Phlyctochytrium bullatum]|nr:hypothetical protein HDU96_010707 [Phlyctochytrium bullatum]
MPVLAAQPLGRASALVEVEEEEGGLGVSSVTLVEERVATPVPERESGEEAVAMPDVSAKLETTVVPTTPTPTPTPTTSKPKKPTPPTTSTAATALAVAPDVDDDLALELAIAASLEDEVEEAVAIALVASAMEAAKDGSGTPETEETTETEMEMETGTEENEGEEREERAIALLTRSESAASSTPTTETISKASKRFGKREKKEEQPRSRRPTWLEKGKGTTAASLAAGAYNVFGTPPLTPDIVVTPPQGAGANGGSILFSTPSLRPLTLVSHGRLSSASTHSHATPITLSLMLLPSEVWTRVCCYLPDPTVFTRTCRAARAMLEGSELFAATTTSSSSLSLARSTRSRASSVALAASQTTNLAFRRDWLFHRYGGHLSLFYAYVKHYKSPARIKAETEPGGLATYASPSASPSSSWYGTLSTPPSSARARSRIGGVVAASIRSISSVVAGVGHAEEMRRRRVRGHLLTMELAALMLRSGAGLPRFFVQKLCKDVVRDPSRQPLVEAVIAEYARRRRDPTPTWRRPPKPPPPPSRLIAGLSLAPSSPTGQQQAPPPPPPARPRVEIPVWAMGSKAVHDALGAPPAEGYILLPEPNAPETDDEDEQHPAMDLWRELFATDDVARFERLANDVQGSPENLERIRQLIVREGFVPVEQLTPTAAFRVFQLSRREMDLLDLLIEKNGMVVGTVNDQILTWVLQGQQQAAAPVEVPVGMLVAGPSTSSSSSSSGEGLSPSIVAAMAAEDVEGAHLGPTTIVMMAPDPQHLLSVYLRRGFRITGPVVTSILRDLSTSNPRSLELLVAVSSLAPPSTLLDCAVELVTRMLGPAGEFNADTLNCLLSMGVVGEQHVRKALLLPAIVARGAVAAGKGKALAGLMGGKDYGGSFPGLPYNTRCYEQTFPYMPWRWVLRTFGPNNVMTRMCFDDLMQWLADISGRTTSAYRPHIPDLNLYSIPLEFMDEGCRVRPYHLPHLAKMATSPRACPFPSVILSRVRKWANVSGGVKDDERREWVDLLRRIAMGREFLRKLLRADAGFKEEVEKGRAGGAVAAGYIGALAANGDAPGEGPVVRRRGSGTSLLNEVLVRGRGVGDAAAAVVTGVSATSSLRGLSPSTHPPSSPHNLSQISAGAMVVRKSSELQQGPSGVGLGGGAGGGAGVASSSGSGGGGGALGGVLASSPAMLGVPVVGAGGGGEPRVGGASGASGVGVPGSFSAASSAPSSSSTSRSPSRIRSGGLLASILPDDPIITYKKSSGSMGGGAAAAAMASLKLMAAGAAGAAGVGTGGQGLGGAVGGGGGGAASLMSRMDPPSSNLLASKPSRFADEAAELYKALVAGNVRSAVAGSP